jgi:hypothetical protein
MAEGEGITDSAKALAKLALWPATTVGGYAVDRVLSSSLVEGLGKAIANHNVVERLVRPMAESGAVEQIVVDALESPVTDRVAERVFESPAAEQLAARAIESELMDQVVARLLESDDLWLLVDTIARSPSVTEAISRQGVGLADQFAGVVRERSNRADDRIERGLRRLLSRSAAAQPADVAPPADAPQDTS